MVQSKRPPNDRGQGRKVEVPKGRRLSIMLTPLQREYAKALGNGSAAKGVRYALDAHRFGNPDWDTRG